MRSTELNGKTYLDVVGKPPGSPPKPVPVKAGSRRSPAPSKAAGVQTRLPGALGDGQALARLEAALELLIRRIDSMGAVLGDVAEDMRTITTLLQQRLPVPPEDPADEPDESDPEDPGPPEPPEPDLEPPEDPDDAHA